MFRGTPTRTSVVLIPALLALLPVASRTLAQGIPAATHPTPPYAQYQQPQYQQAALNASAAPRMRDLFAGTLAAVVEASSGAVASTLTQQLSGTIVGWLDKSNRGKSTAPALSGYAPPSQAADAPLPLSQPQYPTADSQQSYPPYAGNAPAYPAGSQPQYPSSPPDSPPPPGYPGSSAQPPGSIYVGVAYEIHALDANGSSRIVDPATYAFRTGDRFQVHYRPSLPGRIDVYNINAAGQRTYIDTVSVAGGALETLGPYEFTNQKGDETLLLQLSPCSNQALLAATRDIVKADAGVAAPGFRMSDCGNTATRSVRTKGVQTRDIRKVSVESGTSFALDPLQPAEFSSGDVAPREIAITLHHY